MKKIYTILFINLFWFSFGFSQERSTFQTNLPLIRLVNLSTFYTLNKGQFEFDLVGQYTNYRDSRTGVRDLIFLANYGITSNLTLSLNLPFSSLDNRLSDITISDVAVTFKYRFFELNKFQIALSPKISFPTGNKEALQGTGEISFLMNVYSGYELNKIKFFANIGFGQTGYVKSRIRHNPSGSTSLVYDMKNESLIKGSGGVTYYFNPSTMLIFEGIGQIVTKFDDKDFFFQIGSIMALKNHILLKGSAGAGLPANDKTHIISRVALGLSYLF